MSLKTFQRYINAIMVICMINTVLAWQEGKYALSGALGAVAVILLLFALVAIDMEDRL